jgi:hypothetical protein
MNKAKRTQRTGRASPGALTRNQEQDIMRSIEILQAKAELQSALRFFMPAGERAALLANLNGEEAQGIADIVLAVAKTIDTMPKTYQTEGQGTAAVAHLHYFGGAVDAWITERDIGDSTGNGAQLQAFGLITMTGSRQDAELGYISIAELIDNGIELDLYWNPKTLGELMKPSAREIFESA